MSTVPFGKYKGRPVEDMLADADYMGWLESQPWFRQRFAHLSRRDSDALQRTPEHNRLQALFVNTKYCAAFARAAYPNFVAETADIFKQERFDDALKCLERAAELSQRIALLEGKNIPEGEDWKRRLNDESLATYRKSVEAYKTLPASLEGNHPAWCIEDLSFENNNIDVQFNLCVWWYCLAQGVPKHDTHHRWLRFSIEIKPVMGDDYPVVLRQMIRNKSEFLFLGSYEGEGATYGDLLKIFRASKKCIVLKDTVDREAGRSFE